MIALNAIRNGALASVIAITAGFAAPAVAATVTLEKAEASPTGLKAGVRITKAPTDIAGKPAPANVLAYPFEMNVQGTVGSFIAFCVDLANQIKSPAAYDDAGLPPSILGGALGRVQAFYNANYGLLDPLGTSEADKVNGAAFQLGLWEVIYDDNYDIGTGDFTAFASGAARGADINAKAGEFLTAAQNGEENDLYNLSFFNAEDGVSQDLVTAEPANVVGQVPLPAGAWLLLSGVGALAVARRRRRA